MKAKELSASPVSTRRCCTTPASSRKIPDALKPSSDPPGSSRKLPDAPETPDNPGKLKKAPKHLRPNHCFPAIPARVVKTQHQSRNGGGIKV